jgi:D-alanyl-D-alanine carboxypeptidase
VLGSAAFEAIDDAVRHELERTGQPGLTLGLTDREGTIALRAHGLADVASQQPVTPATLFEIGSIGKTFTAIAVLQLADEGRIEIDAAVDRYLPWFAVAQPPDYPPITVAHLLSHTAGIVAGIDATPEAAFQVWSLRDLPTFSPPGERFHYSNVGYKALGLVLEAVEGRPYPEIVRTRILEPLGMAATEPAIEHDIRSRLAVGYEYLHDDRIGHPGAPLAPATWLETDTADGSIASNAADMCALARLILREGDGLLSGEAFRLMSSPKIWVGETAAYAYGLVIRELEGRRLIGHGGGMVGYLAALQVDPESGLGAVVLQNGMSTNPMAIAREALRLARGEEDGIARTPGGPPDDVAGVYVPDDGGDPIELVVSEAGVSLRFSGRELALDELDDDLFLAADPAFDRFGLRVERPAEAALELWHGGRRYVREGAPARQLPEPSDDLRALAGHYRSHNPWTTNFRVVVRGDRPWLIFPAAPDGFDDEQPLTPLPDGSFRAGEDPGNPETLRFDTVVDGWALRAWLSGWPYYRVD